MAAPAAAIELANAMCQVTGCSERFVGKQKVKIQLCARHASDREALLAQAGKAPPTMVGGSKTNLRDYLESLEQGGPDDEALFMEHLNDFIQKCLGLGLLDAL